MTFDLGLTSAHPPHAHHYHQPSPTRHRIRLPVHRIHPSNHPTSASLQANSSPAPPASLVIHDSTTKTCPHRRRIERVSHPEPSPPNPSATGQPSSCQNTPLPTTVLQSTQRRYKCDQPAAGASCTSKRGEVCSPQDARTPPRGLCPSTRRATLAHPRPDSRHGSHFQYHPHSSAHRPSTPQNEAPCARRHTNQWSPTVHLSLPVHVGQEAAQWRQAFCQTRLGQRWNRDGGSNNSSYQTRDYGTNKWASPFHKWRGATTAATTPYQCNRAGACANSCQSWYVTQRCGCYYLEPDADDTHRRAHHEIHSA